MLKRTLVKRRGDGRESRKGDDTGGEGNAMESRKGR
jgi:hypothetical protein